MSYNKNTPIFDFNNNEQSYYDLICYGAIRKQFTRIIPSYYTEIKKQPNRKLNQGTSTSNIEEYKKLKEEINTMKTSIEVLKESKQQKLKQIEDLRALMRKVGTKQYFNNNKYKKQIKNNINNNYCSREKQCTTLENKCLEKNRNNNSKGLSDEGLSLTPTTSGLSSGKDEDMGAEDKGCQDPYFDNRRSSNSSSGSWCFREEEIPENELLIQKNLEGNNTLLRTK